MNLSMKQKHGHIEQICRCQGGGSWGRDRWDAGVSRCKFFTCRMEKQQGPIV